MASAAEAAAAAAAFDSDSERAAPAADTDEERAARMARRDVLKGRERTKAANEASIQEQAARLAIEAGEAQAVRASPFDVAAARR